MSHFERAWDSHKRKAHRQQQQQQQAKSAALVKCHLCGHDVQPQIEVFRQHVRSDEKGHGALDDGGVQKAFQQLTLEPTDIPRSTPSRKRTVSGADNDSSRQFQGDDGDPAEHDPRQTKKLCSPAASDVQQRGSSPTASTPGRSRAKPHQRPSETSADFDRDFQRPPASGRQLYDFEADSSRAKPSGGKHAQAPRQSGRPRQGQANLSLHETNNRTPRQPKQAQTQAQAPMPPFADSFQQAIPVDPERPHTSMEPQIQSRDITHEQLVAEVKGIYTGLVKVESKCMELDTTQSSMKGYIPSNDQWHALIALHRTLLHEHHDFFLASQHPNASPALKRLAAKYAMPARMWRHGIHSFLELLRHRLPHSYEQMLTFIYLAYGMMALLYETVAPFREIWVECLGDLARYRMAIEETDVKDRETWTNVARLWYWKASDKSPETGRLYHHLAILARPKAGQQLYFYVKSLCVPLPFATAKESIMTLFDPILADRPPNLSPVDVAFVRAHGILFSGKRGDMLEKSISDYLGSLDPEIARLGLRWLEVGYYTGIPLACALMGYGAEDHFFFRLVQKKLGEEELPDDSDVPAEPDHAFVQARRLMIATYEIAIRRWGDTNVLPFVHTILAFILHCSDKPLAMSFIEREFPWKLTVMLLNFLYTSADSRSLRIDNPEFPGPHGKDTPRPLPEDQAMRGLIYTVDYHPKSWFTDSKVEEDEKFFELASMAEVRRERLLWIGRRLATSGRWITWDDEAGKFEVSKDFAAAAEDIAV